MGSQLDPSVRQRKRVGDLGGVVGEIRARSVTALKTQGDQEMTACLGLKRRRFKPELVRSTADQVGGVEDVVQMKRNRSSFKTMKK